MSLRSTSPRSERSGFVAVIGGGKIGLPLAVQFAGHGASVVVLDTRPDIVEAIVSGQVESPEPGLADEVAGLVSAGRLIASCDPFVLAAAEVIVVIVPLGLISGAPDFRALDAAIAMIGPAIEAGTTVIIETTVPVGTTRNRVAPALQAISGLTPDIEFSLAFSPERVSSGRIRADLESYPKLVGGIGPDSAEQAARFYRSVLDADVVIMESAEAAELTKLAETTYRDVNIALANEIAGVAERIGVDVQEVIAAANSQPYSHIHQPGLGVGGHCIPIYPRLLLSTDPGLRLVRVARQINDGQLARAVSAIRAGSTEAIGDVLILGLTYRAGVKELAGSRALALASHLQDLGSSLWAYDPLLTDAEIEATGMRPWHWGEQAPIRVIVAQTDDPRFLQIDPAWFPDLCLIYDGRNALRSLVLPGHVRYLGVGVGGRL